MGTLMNTVMRRSAEPQRVEPPADTTAVDDLRSRLAEHQAALTQRRAALTALEDEISERRVARAMGEAVDSQAFMALITQAEALAATCRDDEALIAALEGKLASVDAGERQRRLTTNRAELASLAEQGRRLEAQYIAAATELVERAAELLACRERFDTVASEATRLDPQHGHGQREPRRPFPVPEGYTTSSMPYVPFATWLAGWQADHR